MYKKARCTCKVVILPTKPIAFRRCRYRGRHCFVRSLLSPTDYELYLWIRASVGNTAPPPFRGSPGSSVSSIIDVGTRLTRPELAIFRSASRMPYSILPQKTNLREDIMSMWLYFVSLDKPKFLANEVTNATRNERFIKIIRIPFKLKSPSKTHERSLQKYFTRETTSLVNIPLVPNS